MFNLPTQIFDLRLELSLLVFELQTKRKINVRNLENIALAKRVAMCFGRVPEQAANYLKKGGQRTQIHQALLKISLLAFFIGKLFLSP